MALSEDDLQRAIITWANTQVDKYPELKWLHAIPNGGRRDAKEAMALKSQGVKAGILDLSLDVPRGGFHGLKIELKKPVGKCLRESKEQTEYIDFCIDQGYECIVSNDFEQVKRLIVSYLELK